MLDVVAIDVEMGDEAHGRCVHRQAADAGTDQRADELHRSKAAGARVEEDDVALDRATHAAFAWSSASRARWCSSACSAAAARTPACRIPPPSIFRTRRASWTNARGPIRTEPTGQPRPLLKQKLSESKCSAIVVSGIVWAMQAFHTRAPSRWTARPSVRPASTTAFSWSSG